MFYFTQQFLKLASVYNFRDFNEKSFCCYDRIQQQFMIWKKPACLSQKILCECSEKVALFRSSSARSVHMSLDLL